MQDRRNEVIRHIAQVCAHCGYSQGKGPGLVCARKRGCPSKKVKQWLKELQEIEQMEAKA